METALPELSVAEVSRRLGEPGFAVFDANHVARWARGHVPGARQVDAQRFAITELPDDRDATLVFYCSGPG